MRKFRLHYIFFQCTVVRSWCGQRYGFILLCLPSLWASGERKSAFFGVLLNQVGLACVQLFKIDEAAKLFEEARAILEQECGPCHQDTLGVYNNLAAKYDALGRIEVANILMHM